MNRPIQRALISVYDKTGLVEFAGELIRTFGVHILSTGGTAKHLIDAGLNVELVEKLSGFGEMLSGRVKTLHPAIHAGILADRSNPEHRNELRKLGIGPIDLVVVDFYPFERVLDDPAIEDAAAIEWIDIGGPCMLRAAAKNFRDVLAVSGPGWYALTLSELRSHRGQTTLEFRRRLAQATFAATSEYDRAVTSYFERDQMDQQTPVEARPLGPPIALRYGENPDQKGWYQAADTGSGTSWRAAIAKSGSTFTGDQGDKTARVISASDLSFNNLLDADAAWSLCTDIARSITSSERVNSLGGPSKKSVSPAVCVFVKHNNPCGAAVADDPIAAYRNAYLGDPSAAMGGVLACNFPIDESFAGVVMETSKRWGAAAGVGGFFVDVWLAPNFSPDLRAKVLTQKPWGERVRLVNMGAIGAKSSGPALDRRTAAGGWLLQTTQPAVQDESLWRVASKRAPSVSEWADLRLAWICAILSKSNAISIVRDQALIGSGVGQTSRNVSCQLATLLARQNGHEARLSGASAASDGFFPFSDGPKMLMDAGITAIIHPGGSKKDADTISLCDERGIALLLTGVRHFRH